MIDLAFERPDFNSAVYQFLVGLYQTIYTPKDDDEWLDRLEEPPDTEEMHGLMTPIADNFELLGERPRYMQDASVSSASDKRIMGLLITNPGENTMKLGKDFFIKGRSGGGLCRVDAVFGSDVSVSQLVQPGEISALLRSLYGPVR